MRKKKLLVIAALVAIVLLVGSLGGIVLAQAGSTDNTATSGNTLLARVASILGIDQQKLEGAFTQAQAEMRQERLDTYLKGLVDQGKITQEQADQYKAWLNSKPDMSQYQQQMKDWNQARPSLPPELNEWQQAKPNIPLPGKPAPFNGGPGFGGSMRMGGGRIF